MDPTVAFVVLLVVALGAGFGWVRWAERQKVLPPPPEVDEPEEGEPYETEVERPEQGPALPDLQVPAVATADAAVAKWFGERLGGPRGWPKAERDKRIANLTAERGLTPGLAAMVAYNELCQQKQLSPKRPPAEVRAAMETLGVKRGRFGGPSGATPAGS